MAALMAIFLNGLLAGTFIGSTLVEQAVKSLRAPAWIAYKQAKEVVFGAVMPGFLGLTILSSVVAAFFGTSRSAFLVSALLLIGILVITIVVHLPINKFIQSADRSDVPSSWNAMRSRWRNWNYARTALAVLAFVSTVLGSSMFFR